MANLSELPRAAEAGWAAGVFDLSVSLEDCRASVLERVEQVMGLLRMFGKSLAPAESSAGTSLTRLVKFMTKIEAAAVKALCGERRRIVKEM